MYYCLIVLWFVLCLVAGDEITHDDLLASLSGRRYANSRASLRQQAPGRKETVSSSDTESPLEDRVLGWTINDEDAYLVGGKKGWDYGRAGVVLTEEVMMMEEDKDKEIDQSDEQWGEEQVWAKLLEDEDAIRASQKNFPVEATEGNGGKGYHKDEHDDDDDDDDDKIAFKIKKKIRNEKGKWQVLEDAAQKKNLKHTKPDRPHFLIRFWGKERMVKEHKRRLMKSMDQPHHLKQLQVRSLYFLQETHHYAALLNERVTILPKYSLRNNMDHVVMHLQFYINILEVNKKDLFICEIKEQMEGAKNHLRVRFGQQHLIVDFALKGVEQVQSVRMSNVILQDWYHVRIVALQTKVTVTITPPGTKKVTLMIKFPHHPVLAFAAMGVSVGEHTTTTYVMGLSLNNRLKDLTKAVNGNKTELVTNPFTFSPPVYIPDDATHFIVHCDQPYKFKYVYQFEIDLPVPRPKVTDSKPRLLLFGPTSKNTGWALALVYNTNNKYFGLKFCLDWINNKNCVTTTQIVLASHEEYALKCIWKDKQQSFTVEKFDMKTGLYERQAMRYKGLLPQCSSEVFIGGLDRAWQHKLAASKNSVSYFHGSLTRVVINKFNIQLNAMVPKSLGKQNYAALLNRGQSLFAAKRGSIPKSPIFVSVPVFGNETHNLSCSYDSMMKYKFFADAKFKAFWIDQDGNYIAESNDSYHGRSTSLYIDNDRVDNLYACVIRMEGVFDMVPVTYAVFQVDRKPRPPASVNTFAAHFLGTAICRGLHVTMCQTYKNVEEEEFIEVRDWKNIIPVVYRLFRNNWMEPLYSGDFAHIKVTFWAFVMFFFVIVFLFVVMPVNKDGHGGATSCINRFLVNWIFTRRLAFIQNLLLMDERRRPYPYRPRRSVYHFAEKEAYFTAPQKMLLYQCQLLEPPDPETDLIAYVMWSCLEIGQLDAIEAQDIILYFNLLYDRPQPVIMSGYTFWRDDWLKARYGKKVHMNDDKLEKQYRHLHLGGRNPEAQGHLEQHVRDMFVHYVLKPCLDELEAIYWEVMSKAITPERRRIVRRRVWDVDMAVRVYCYYQKLPRHQIGPSFRHLPCFDQRKLYEHRQIAWVLLKHAKTIHFQLDEGYGKRIQRRMQLIFHKIFTDLQELRVRRYKSFLQHDLPAAKVTRG